MSCTLKVLRLEMRTELLGLKEAAAVVTLHYISGGQFPGLGLKSLKLLFCICPICNQLYDFNVIFKFL